MGALTGLMIAARVPQEVGKLMIVDALPFIGTLFNPAATVDSMKPQAEQMAAMMRAQYGQPAPTGPIKRSRPGAHGRQHVEPPRGAHRDPWLDARRRCAGDGACLSRS